MELFKKLIEDCYKNNVPCIYECATYADLDELNTLLDRMLVYKEELENIPELDGSDFMQLYEELTNLVDNLLDKSCKQQVIRNRKK